MAQRIDMDVCVVGALGVELALDRRYRVLQESTQHWCLDAHQHLHVYGHVCRPVCSVQTCVYTCE